MSEKWKPLEYRKALNELIRDVDPNGDSAGRWSTFLRESIRTEIETIRAQLSDMHALYEPHQLERYNRLSGKIEGLQRLLLPDFGLGVKLAAMIGESQ